MAAGKRASASVSNLRKLMDAGVEKKDIADAIGVDANTLSKVLRTGEMTKVMSVACEALLRRQGKASYKSGVLIISGASAELSVVEQLVNRMPLLTVQRIIIE